MTTTKQQVDDALALIEGQRRDFDALGEVLGLRDQLDDDRNRTNMENAEKLHGVYLQLQEIAGLAYSLQDRLHWYETRVPGVLSAKKAYDRALALEKRRREQLIESQPGLSEEDKQRIRATGKPPEASPVAPEPDPNPAPADENDRPGIDLPPHRRGRRNPFPET